jgi:hypothetical protein
MLGDKWQLQLRRSLLSGGLHTMDLPYKRFLKRNENWVHFTLWRHENDFLVADILYRQDVFARTKQRYTVVSITLQK